MPTNGCQKGKAGERELSAELRRLFGVDCRRGQQYCGANGDADVVGLPGIHVECKRVEALNIHGAVEQAQADAMEGDVPVVFHRRNRTPWLVTLRLEDVEAFVKRMACVIHAKDSSPEPETVMDFIADRLIENGRD